MNRTENDSSIIARSLFVRENVPTVTAVVPTVTAVLPTVTAVVPTVTAVVPSPLYIAVTCQWICLSSILNKFVVVCFFKNDVVFLITVEVNL
jgi:hypothetical protein